MRWVGEVISRDQLQSLPGLPPDHIPDHTHSLHTPDPPGPGLRVVPGHGPRALLSLRPVWSVNSLATVGCHAQLARPAGQGHRAQMICQDYHTIVFLHQFIPAIFHSKWRHREPTKMYGFPIKIIVRLFSVL